jgi:MFS family permease
LPPPAPPSSYLQSILDAKPEEVFIGTTAGAVIYAFVCPLAGALSDRVGRRPVMFASSVGLVVFTWPIFLLMGEVTFFTIVFGQVAGYDPSPAFYVMAFSVAILAVLARMPETYHKRLTLKPSEEPAVRQLSEAT